MTSRTTKFKTLALAGLAAGSLAFLAACSSGDPLASGGDETTSASTSGGDTIVVGSQAYYSNTIIAEIYAQALEAAGYTVEREFELGQREAYIPAIEGGEVDVFPEYTGNLLQYLDPEATATEAEAVYDALEGVLPEGLAVLEMSPAADQDSYNVTAAFAEEHGLESLEDLASVDVPIILGGQPELEDRPYGPSGLQELYGVTVEFDDTGDTTVESLVAGTINMANVYSADPLIDTNDLVTLADPKGLFLASNVVPLVDEAFADELAEILDPINAALTSSALVEMNLASTEDAMSADDIARDWLTANGFLE